MIEPIVNGVLMRDLITYQPPFGIIGDIANRLVIKRKISEIFEFRKTALVKHFGAYHDELPR